MAYKKIIVKTSVTANPTVTFVDEEADVAAILQEVGATASKNVATIEGEEVEASFVPDNDSTIILMPKKYSSGAF